MVAHVWRMRAKKKKAEDYEKFGRQMTLPALRKIKGCQDAHFMRVESRKPEYLWVVMWDDLDALEAARNDPAWKEQIKKFEAGGFYKTIPLELVCRSLGSFSAGAGKTRRAKRAAKSEAPEAQTESKGSSGPAPEGE